MRLREYPKNWPALSRYVIYVIYDGICQHCGLSKADHLNPNHFPVILQCAHLDHDKTNNAIENLTCLCQKCHTRYDKNQHLPNPKIHD